MQAVQDLPTVLDVGLTLDGVLGFELLDVGDEHARGRVAVEDRVRQPFGLVHGGVYAALAESIASIATFRAVHRDGMIAMGSSNQTSFLRPITSGTVHADARRRHRGRTSWMWDVDFSDDEGRLCATTRIAIAVRPAPS
ncbi:MAG: PaaI family thioesterase [Thermoleophilaceae bacterium]|jgi:1,4-dihydroxy-2-naphthoyl-CoA hydrolase|nr:PaaI family thioesterase [Thermoleophilaceae bacterium]